MTDPGRWEASLRWSLVFSVAALAFAMLVQAWLGPGEFRWPLVLAGLAYVVVGVSFALRELGPGAAPSAAWPWALVTIGAALTATAAARVGMEGATPGRLAATTLVVVAPGAAAMIVAPRWRWPALISLAAALAALTMAVLVARGVSWRFGVATAGAGFVASLILAAAGRLTAWMREAGRELVAAREARARLAVAEERLRFARDLHDVHGRTLAAVSVHSQVGAELARRGDPAAVDHMTQVQRLAHEALGETRRLVTGYRELALGEEVESARALLRAGGIGVRVLWPPEDAVPAGAASSALAAVVREGVTNVLRHSAAGEVTLRLERHDADWRLTVENDGLPRSGAGATEPGGTGAARREPAGLAGLRERLAQVGGRLDVASGDGRYALIAHVPEGERG